MGDELRGEAVDSDDVTLACSADAPSGDVNLAGSDEVGRYYYRPLVR